MPPLGSWLLGNPTEPLRRQRIRVALLLAVLLLGLNIVGAVVVAVLVGFVIPGPNLLDRRFAVVGFLIGPTYIAVALVVGVIWGTAVSLRATRWARMDRVPTRGEQSSALTLPWQLTLMQAVLWLGAGAVYTTAYAIIDATTIAKVAITFLFSGVVVCGFGYIFSEFALRPVAARALDAGGPHHVRSSGAAGRGILTWVVGTGVPVAGLIVSAIFALTRNDTTVTQLSVTVLALGGITLGFGFLLTALGIKATVDPIRSVTGAMAKIERGELEASVVVYDGTEVGELQSGFNRMVDGLREREQIRDLFGRHVSPQVAEAALRHDPELGGEERTVAVLFVDIIGSTGLASKHSPREVVDLLNRFFEVVVAEVDRHHGIVNKFEGDAALAIFGAPVELPDAAGLSLAAARAIRFRLAREVTDCDAAIGVAYGVVVAGNIGARDRFEYTVIGDPVNEAARLCELAKNSPHRLLASEHASQAAGPQEAQRWQLGDPVLLRGRSEPTRPASPVD